METGKGYKTGGTVLLDVGGTNLKGAYTETDSVQSGQICQFPAMADGGREEILAHLAAVIGELAGPARVERIGFAFPGPFDYARGISQMRGIGKYDAIFGVPLREALVRRRPELAEARFLFLHDIEAFALGESACGEARRERRLFCLCIGTGAGSAFLEDGKVLKGTAEENAAGEMRQDCGAANAPVEMRQDCARQAGVAVPRNGWIYDTPFRDSIIDDYLSVRGLKKIAREVLGYEADGRELARLCAVGTALEPAGAGAAAEYAGTLEKDRMAEAALAREVWRQFGQVLAEAAEPFLAAFRPDGIVLGGQISKSFAYFGEALQKICADRQVRIYLEPQTSLRAMQGLQQAMRGEAVGSGKE